VMNLGEIVEAGEREQITSRPEHPYTQRLLAAAPRLGERHARRAGELAGGDPLVQIRSLSVVRSGASRRTLFGPAPRTTVALDDVSLDIRKGEILGVIGESGSGKSTLLKTLSGLLTPTSGAVAMDGHVDLGTRTADRQDDLLHRIQMVFQNPDDSLNPAHTVRRILAPGVRRRRVKDAELVELLHTVGLEPEMLDRLPGQLSGGEKQRVAIARALARRPELLLLDEVTSALDVTVQAEVLATLLDIHQRLGTTMVFVSHDLAVVSSVADRVAVLRNGRLVEMGDVEQVLDRPSDPYTDHLVSLARFPA